MWTFITGNSGFIGLALTEALLKSGDHVIGFDAGPPPAYALARLKKLPGKLIHITGDIRDPAALDKAMASQRCDALVSLAAVTADAARARRQPGMIYEVNVVGVLNAIEAATRHGVSRFVHLSSGSVYGQSGYEYPLLDEIATPLQPEGLYGMSKQAAERAALQLQKLYGIDLVIGRLGTCFGPWEHDTGFRDTLSAPLQLLKLAENGDIAVLPYNSKRDWLYVRDAAAAIVCLLKNRRLRHHIYNVAAGFEFSLSSWCHRLQSQYPGFQWHIDGADGHSNINLYGEKDRASMDISRLLSDTPFEPVYELDAAFDDYIDWTKQVANCEAQTISAK